ncbi:MAG: ATP-binding protein [Ktedonobacteraceae bacterium]
MRDKVAGMLQFKKLWTAPWIVRGREVAAQWTKQASAGMIIMLSGMAAMTLLIIVLDRIVGPLSNPGLIYLLLIAMLAYFWGWRITLIAVLLELVCIYYFFVPPAYAFKGLTAQSITQLVTITAVTLFVLALVGLARQRRALAEQRAEQLSALNRVGTALASELDEERLLHLIAETARNVTGANFAAFTLRPVNELGQPVVAAEGNLFHLAAVVGVTKEQERLFRRMPLGGEGLLAPIFRYGVPVRVPDALAMTHGSASLAHGAMGDTTRKDAHSSRETAREVASFYAQGTLSREELQTLGVPRGHPVVRSFLGVPLLDRNGQVRGGLLLGHTEPNRFTSENESILIGLAAQAAVALENARLFHEAQTQTQELDAIFESITDAVTLIDEQGKVLRENHAARQLRESVEQTPDGMAIIETVLREPVDRALHGKVEQGIPVSIADGQKEHREYIVSVAPLLSPGRTSGPLQQQERSLDGAQLLTAGAVVVWHEVTEAHRLIMERRAHAETKAQLTLLQTVLDGLPGSVYLVRGKDARLVLANDVTAEIWGARWATGQPMNEFLATNHIRVFRNDGRPIPLDELATIRSLQTGVSVRHHQEIIRHTDGTTLPVLVNAVAFDAGILSWSSTDEEQSTEREPVAIVVHQDVTALKEAERLKDDFIGIAAHELRTPLAALKGYAQMLMRQAARGNGQELADWQTEAVEAIDTATTRLVELIDDLLDVTRLQGGQLELQSEPADLVALLQRVIGRCRVTTGTHTLTFAAIPEHIVVTIDQQRIEQVMTNLINNAIKYSPDGGNIEMTVCEKPESGQALLSICDNGIGIPREQQGRIFGRFERADNAREREIKGTGLGLYLCRELVERHGGRIWFESTEGQGSTFFALLLFNYAF